jgi:hypothetical protein
VARDGVAAGVKITAWALAAAAAEGGFEPSELVVPTFPKRAPNSPTGPTKAGTGDARHLAWLRDETGDAFAAGIVLHTGPHVFPLGERIVAAPVSALWS